MTWQQYIDTTDALASLSQLRQLTPSESNVTNTGRWLGPHHAEQSTAPCQAAWARLMHFEVKRSAGQLDLMPQQALRHSLCHSLCRTVCGTARQQAVWRDMA
jgi:hypothetical protein